MRTLCKTIGIMCAMLAAVAVGMATITWFGDSPGHLAYGAVVRIRLEILACAIAIMLASALCIAASEAR